MEKEVQSGIIIFVLVLIVMTAVLLVIPSKAPLLGPPVYESCSPPERTTSEITATGSSEYTLGDSSTPCVSSPLYAGALRSAQSKAKESALTLCKNAPPQRISCDNSCSPVYTEGPNCEIQFPILTKILTTKEDNGITCEVTATVKVKVEGEYQCVLK